MIISNFVDELAKLDITLSETQLEQLNEYYNLLIEWNTKINLTGIIEQKDVYLKHFYDSLTIAKIINLNNVNSLCDIGTGAGFPGLVLKIVYPNLQVTLVDSLNKRINFLNDVISKLNLTKIETISTRAEEYAIKNREKYDVVTARAVANLHVLLEYSIPLVKVNGLFIAMKSDVTEELINLDKCMQQLNIEMNKKIEFLLPIENSKRTLLSFKKIKETSKKFPRKYSDIKKRPL